MAFQAPSRALIVGLGRSGLAAALLASRDGTEVWVTDLRSEAELAATTAELPGGVRLFLGGHPGDCLEGVDLVITSPGVPPTAPILETARRRGRPVMTEIEFAWQHRPSPPLVAVTGSNGKSTVTVLTAEMLTASGINAVAGGNLGPPASELVLEPSWHTWVLEISSFQAELLGAMQARVAVFLNLSQDHLERHPDIDAYVAAKRNLFALQQPSDAAVLNADDEAAATTPTRGRRLFFSLRESADAWLDGDALVIEGEALIHRDRIALSGRHNLANALAAALAARELGATGAGITATLESFQGLDHRHRTVHVAGGVNWVDDSKATNVGATNAALGGYPPATVHLILGGQGKGQDFTPLASEVRRAVIAVYLIGADRGAIAAALADTVPLHDCATLAEAVRQARAAARPGETVLLAPACASFDQFSGYAERGHTFATFARGKGDACP